MGAVYLQHVFLENKVPAPGVEYVSFQGTARGPQVEKSFDPSMYFETWDNKHLTTNSIVEGCFIICSGL